MLQPTQAKKIKNKNKKKKSTTANVLHEYCFVTGSVKQYVLLQSSIANLLYTMHYLNIS